MHPNFRPSGGEDYKVAIVGTGAPFSFLIDALERSGKGGRAGRSLFAAVIAPGLAGPEAKRLNALGLDVFPDATAMFRTHGDVNLVFDLRTDDEAVDDTLPGVPMEVPVIAMPTASLLIEIVTGMPPPGGSGVRRSHSRELLNTIINEMEEDILLLDPSGRVQDMNRNVFERHGLSKADFIGRHCREIEAAGFCQRGEDLCPFQETLRTGQKAEAVHTRVDETGRVLYYRVYTYPVLSRDGELTHVVEVRRDITDRTHTEQQLLQAQKMAALGELSTYAAHEIRNPLFAIGGFANSLLRSTNLSEREREKVNIILKESRRLEEILKSMLNFARPTDGVSAVVDVNDVVTDAVNLMRHGYEQHGITLQTELDSGIANAQGTPELIKQCLINMLKNSMESMHESGWVSVVTRMSGRWVELIVRDNGPGIPVEMQNKVFNPFFSTKDKGSGLGLAMTRKIVDDLGGKLLLESTPGSGTSITMRLVPVAAVEDPLLDEEPLPE